MTTISWLSLAWCALPIFAVSLLYFYWNGKPVDVLMSGARMSLQLIGVGYILVFLFGHPSPWLSLSILSIMICAASWIALRPVKYDKIYLKPVFVALFVSVGIHLFITLYLVLNVSPWYSPNIIIPLAGMYFSNSMNAISIAIERYHAGLQDGSPVANAKMKAFHAAMIPQLNSLLAVGLVSLPGMMTGQILSGVSPLVAVRYQIMIMTMVVGTSGIAAALMLWLVSKAKRSSADL